MKKLTVSTAVLLATVSTASIANASVLSDLMADLADASGAITDLSGVFANVAENADSITGTVTNTVDASTDAFADGVAGDAVSIAFSGVEIDFGDIATTVLGAVNTGTINLGVSSELVSDASSAVSGVNSATAESIDSKVSAVGAMIDGSTAVALNLATNAGDIDGSVTNDFTDMNGSLGNVATTVLGAVNTGTITSGVTTGVAGAVTGIVGQ